MPRGMGPFVSKWPRSAHPKDRKHADEKSHATMHMKDFPLALWNLTQTRALGKSSAGRLFSSAPERSSVPISKVVALSVKAGSGH